MHFLNDLFSHPTVMGGILIAGKTTIIYMFLILGLRLLGKRELGQMTIYDLVLIIILANAVQNAMVGSDNSLVGGLIAATTLLVFNKLFTLALARSRPLARRMIGDPLLIVNNGHLFRDRMDREGITRDQVMAALREHGLTKIEDVRMAVLEVDGSISVVPNDSNVFKSRRHFRALRLG